MAKITTEDCKKFLADFFASNPQPLCEIYRGNPPKDLLRHSILKSEWSREHKCKAVNSYYGLSEYTISDGRATWQCPSSGFLWERKFVLKPSEYDTAIAYLVLEDKDGNLFLGDYVGD